VKYQKSKYYNPDIQVLAMKSNYPQFTVKRIGKGEFEFVGELTVKPELPTYTVSITYRGNLRPIVQILNPPLVENAPHVYPTKKDLCLYHPDNYHWTGEKLIARNLVPWTAAWIYFYEVWLQKGIWYGPEAIHNVPKK
jgi:hypothetical protein